MVNETQSRKGEVTCRCWSVRQCIITAKIQLLSKDTVLNTVLCYLTLRSNMEISWGREASMCGCWGQWESAGPSRLLWNCHWQCKNDKAVTLRIETTVKNALVITICVAIATGVFYGVVPEKMLFKSLNHWEIELKTLVTRGHWGGMCLWSAHSMPQWLAQTGLPGWVSSFHFWPLRHYTIPTGLVWLTSGQIAEVSDLFPLSGS